MRSKLEGERSEPSPLEARPVPVRNKFDIKSHSASVFTELFNHNILIQNKPPLYSARILNMRIALTINPISNIVAPTTDITLT